MGAEGSLLSSAVPASRDWGAGVGILNSLEKVGTAGTTTRSPWWCLPLTKPIAPRVSSGSVSGPKLNHVCSLCPCAHILWVQEG